MKTAILAFTPPGIEVAERAKNLLGEADLFFGGRCPGEGPPPGWEGLDPGLVGAVGSLIARYRALVFVSAAGIAVRAIAPHLRSKECDPAVVVVDDLGRYAISLVSGHLGGANELAERLAAGLGAEPVVTTATDARGFVSPDLLVRDFGWVPEPRGRLKEIAVAMANGREVAWYCEPEFFPILGERLGPGVSLREIGGAPGDHGGPSVLVTPRDVDLTGSETLALRPANLAAGVGCRMGIGSEVILGAVRAALAKAGVVEVSLGCLVSVDIKASEPGLVEAARRLGVPLLTVARTEILGYEGSYSRSEFVKQAIGVEGVCEPVAMLIAGTRRLILDKTVFPEFPGVTLALAAAGPETCRSWASARGTPAR